MISCPCRIRLLFECLACRRWFQPPWRDSIPAVGVGPAGSLGIIYLMSDEEFPGMRGGHSEPSDTVMVVHQDVGKEFWEEGQLFPPKNFDSSLVAYVEGDLKVIHQRGF